MSLRRRSSCVVLFACLIATTAQAQTPPPPPPPEWTGSLGFGLALTEGNRDTSTLNASYELKRELESSPFVFLSKGLFLRGSTEGELSANRLGLEARLDRKLGERTSIFGQVQYLRDRFKEIDYLVSPTVGVAHKIVDTDRTLFAVNGGVGAVWEKNTDAEVRVDGAISAGQQLEHKLSDTATFTQRIDALWKAQDLDDSLYTFGLGVAAGMTTRTQLKVEIVDTFKNRPPNPSVQKNDVSLLMSIVFKY